MAKQRSKFKNCCAKTTRREGETKPLSYVSLFKYSTPCERVCILLGLFLALISGSVPPFINILYGEFCYLMMTRQYPSHGPPVKLLLLPLFGGGQVLENATAKDMQLALRQDSAAWGSACAAVTSMLFVFSLMSIFLLCFTSSRQITRIKILFFKSILCKDLSWFDTKMRGNFAGQASENLLTLERGIDDTLAVFSFHVTVGILNILISFIYGWLLSLVLVVVITPFLVCAFFVAKFQGKLAAKETRAFTRAGSVAEEVFNTIRTVVAFGGEEKEIERYKKSLINSKRFEIRRGVASGISNGLMWFIIYCSYAVAFVFGVRLIVSSKESGDCEYTPADMLIIFFGVVTAMTSLAYATGRLELFSTACGAAAEVFEVINTKSLINPCSEAGQTEEFCRGEIEFKQVYFEYPSRSGSMTLRGLNLKIKAGETVAIVGESGAGKSTVLNLIQRFYDPVKGTVLLDGQDIKTLNVSWLREQLGVVNQEPELFSTTIRENIWYGDLRADDDDIKEAAISAGAYDFIMDLKEGFNTIVGQRGSTLSGGQKQRIAIARALINNPKILILDEATSGLDYASERVTQAALNRASRGRTTLVVTHRLSNIMAADRIVVLGNGVVAEEGTHDELMKANGIYKRLFENQGEVYRGNRSRVTVESSSQIIYKESTYLPPGPRGRLNSITGLPRSVKADELTGPEQYKDIGYSEIIKWTKPNMGLFFIGSLASIISGAGLPAVCVLFADIFGLLGLADFKEIKSQTDVYAAILVAVGVTSGICVYLQMYCFAAAGVKLSSSLRIKAFKCFIRQEIGFFEDEKNTVGALCVRLVQDPSGIQGSFDVRLGVLMQALSTMLLGLILSFIYNVKITLVALATLPFLFSGVYIESVFASGILTVENKATERASKIAVEVISGIRTVAALSRETFFIEKYTDAILEGQKNSMEKFWLRSFAFAVGQSVPYFGYAITLWYGAKLMAEENLHYKYVIKVTELLIFGAWTLGQSMVLGPSLRETKLSAGRLNYIFSRNSKVADGYTVLTSDRVLNTSIGFSKVHFAYPARPSTMALQNFSMRIEPGKSIGIMGPTGSGKSTIIQLLLRFFDPVSGSIAINKANIKGFKLASLRRLFGVVFQDPEFFSRTVMENIAYGDNTREVTFEEIKAAAKGAKIHDFIQTLPSGYDTLLGPGIQLSGGQKQRLAIARVIVRNPEILILDEATSSLDPESEATIQNTLSLLAAGRTTLTIGHHLSSVKNAEIIYIIEKGSVKEFGTPDELMNLGGYYAQMKHEEDEKTAAASAASEAGGKGRPRK